MADLWSDYTDALIKEIDRGIGDKYKIGIADLLSNVQKYASRQNIQTVVGNMREDVNRYIDDALKGMPEQVKAMEESLAKANEITRQLAQNISMQTRQHNVPLIKPFNVARNTANEETIEVDRVDDQVLRLAERLTDGAIMVADFTTDYKNTTIGSWLFGREGKNYVLMVRIEPNDAINMELSRQELNDLFDAASASLRG
ncbi:MAG: hypothetical protein M1160_03770 [Candidatus Marsarchaeota archaeon]|jgi:uncharacterized protein YeeX (DUF496 family)|nr:hypothetical protein [Candidatus Marsarchaeota archaeon]MCL5111960.1 hypothetical protein [Candidatus Marsarchaeota archaeon]